MQDEIGDGVTPEERLAELARGDVAEPVHVLHGEGVGEPQIVHDAHAILFRHSRVALHPEDGHERIAGQDAQDDEDDQRDPEEGPEGEESPPGEVFAHA